MSESSVDLYDVIVIGGGVVGCAILRELTKYDVRALLLERASDVCEGTSKANSAIIHTGFDAKPGTLEAKLVAESSRLFPRLAEQLKIPFDPVGAVLVARSDEEAARLPALKAEGERNGVDDLRILTRDEVLAREPHVNPSVKAGLLVPRESITCGFTTVVAYAENALANGASIMLSAPVTAIQTEATAGGRPVKRVFTPRGDFRARYVVNAAGLWSDEVRSLLAPSPFRVRPRKGEFLILDRSSRSLVNGIILPMPTPKTKGILVTPTIYGNVLMGPTAVDVERKDDLSVTAEGLQQVEAGSLSLVPALKDLPIVSTYAGLRAGVDAGDYIVSFQGGTGWVDVAGIRSTGLTSSPALARYVVEGLRDIGLELREKDTFEPSRPPYAMPGWYAPRPFADPDRMSSSPGYGRMVCYCEAISEQEIVDAVRAPLPAQTLDAVKRRTRAMTGRCQGFNCMARVANVMARSLGVPVSNVTKCGPGSEVVLGAVHGPFASVASTFSQQHGANVGRPGAS